MENRCSARSSPDHQPRGATCIASRIRAPMRAESPLYAPRAARGAALAPVPASRARRRARRALLAILVGLAFAGSRSELAAGYAGRRRRRRRADEARGGREARRAVRAGARPIPSSSPPATRRTRSPPNQLARRSPTGAQRSRPRGARATGSGRSGASGASARGFRRRGAPSTRGLERSARVRARPDLRGRRIARRRAPRSYGAVCGSEVVPEQDGTSARSRSRGRGRSCARSASSSGRPAPRRCPVDGHGTCGDGRDAGRAAERARTAVSAPVRPEGGRAGSFRLPRWRRRRAPEPSERRGDEAGDRRRRG